MPGPIGILRHGRVATATSVIAALVAIGATMPPVAHADGTYTIGVCTSGYGNVNNAIAFSESWQTMASGQGCANGSQGSGQGLQVWSIASTPGGNGAGWWFHAPAGTSIVGLSESGIYSALDGWVAHWATSEDGSGDPGEPGCDATGCETQNPAPTYVGVNHASEIGFAIWCHSSSCKANDSLSFFGPAGSANVGQAEITIDEPSAPYFPTFYGSLVNHPGWISANVAPAGGWYVVYNATDPAGVCILQAGLTNTAGAWVELDQHNVGPNYTVPAPCVARPGYTWYPNIAALPDGAYYLHAQANNPAGMGSDATGATGMLLQIDNTPPSIRVASAPAANRWYNAPQQVIWTASDASSGVEGVSCTDGWHPGASSDTMTVSHQGSNVVTCNALDNAGNPGQNGGASATVNLDSQTPSVSFRGPSQSAWLRGPQTVTIDASEQQPLSGIAGISCSLDGASATWTAGNEATVTATADGVNTVRCSAETNAGTWSQAGTYTVHLDSSPPTVSFSNGPAQGRWYGTVQSIQVTGQDEAGLDQVSQISCAINGQATLYQGSQAQITVQPPGGQLVCSGQDQAGNWSQSQAWNFLIDNTPPTGYFAPPDLNNPDQVSVTVGDTQSGVAGGQIQIQAAGGWQTLSTGYDSTTGQLVGTIPDDGSVSDGNHALRALVSDAVGNQATITNSVVGTPESVRLPLRIVTQLHAGAADALVRRCTAAHIRLRPATRRSSSQQPPARVVRRCSTVTVPTSHGPLHLHYGQRGSVRVLLASADGEPVAHAWVDVTAQAPGWTVQRAGMVRTDSTGRFTYRIHPGPSRTITFSFPGTNTLRAASASTSVRVEGRATITASPVARAGHKLRLSGRVLGGYIPPGGTLIQLQYRVAGYPEGWAPFDVLVRSRRNGFWGTSVTLPRSAAHFTYLIRAVISSQNGWPWAGAVTNVVTRHVLG
jgi:hypothetical protein